MGLGFMDMWLPICFRTDFRRTARGGEYAQNREAEYAVITVTEPMIRPFERIPTGKDCFWQEGAAWETGSAPCNFKATFLPLTSGG